MNKIVSSKRISIISLATLIVFGTIATILPSLQAQPYYEDGYTSEYPSYNDDNDYKSKDNSNTIVKKIKCNNINSNNNGVDVTIGVPPSDDAIAEAQAEDVGNQAPTAANGWGNGERNNNKDFTFVCKNDNNNINNIEQINPPPVPTPVAQDAHLVVSKFVTCEPSPPPPDNTLAIPACEEIEGERGGPIFQFLIEPNEFNITVSGDNPNPSQFEGSSFPDLPVVVTLGAGNYQVSETADPSVATTIAALEQIYSVDITQSVIFSGDCDAITGEGTIVEGEVHLCQIENAFTATALPPGGLTASNTNTDTSSFDINTDTAGGLTHSFSSPPTIAQETEEGLSALEKTAKLKAQWLDLLP